MFLNTCFFSSDFFLNSSSSLFMSSKVFTSDFFHFSIIPFIYDIDGLDVFLALEHADNINNNKIHSCVVDYLNNYP